jgi:hypothetical protein
MGLELELNIVKTGQRCQSLLSKGIFINAGLPKGEEVAGDGNFWCGKTQHALGPDNEICDDEYCRDPGRSCYEAS